MEGKSIEVTVRTPSRLHFSMIDIRGDLGRIHGSVGVAIDRPNIILKARLAPHIKVIGPRADRAEKFAEVIIKDSGVEGGAEIEVVTDIREHSGFGSGTQLGLAVGTALSELFGLSLTPEEIALKLKRSKRSGVGTYAFKYGGFIVDGGHRVDGIESLPPLLFRIDVPEDWLFVIGVPEIPRSRSGSLEINAFKRLEPPPLNVVGEISRLILVQMIPAIIEHDIISFGEAMTSIDHKFGESWLDVQGGLFSHQIIEAGVGFLLDIGAFGAGQSSWGPAFYGLADGETHAEEISWRLDDFLNSEGRHGKAFVAQPDNRGAVVTVMKE
jgi:beta-ribofuranosylaminobenzene 5'-phosphate synthase